MTYLKNDVELPISARIRTSHNPNSGVVSLKLDDTNVNDAGSYKVVAQNPGGVAETAGAVYVNKTPVIDMRPVIDLDAFKYLNRPEAPKPAQEVTQNYLPPNFVVGLPANCRLHEGEPLKLTCQVEGVPKPSVSDFKIYSGY